MRIRTAAGAIAGLSAIALLVPATADATFPGTNGRIALRRRRADRLLRGAPWDDSVNFVMDADGQNESPLVTGPDNEFSPDWQPLNPPSCSLTGPSKSKSVKEVVVTVLCSENANAAATGELTAKAPKLRLAVASKKKHVPLPPATASVTPGTPTAITLAIPKKGRKALKKSGKPGTATIAVTLTDDTAQSSTLTQTIKVKPKKKKK
jgi:hypothetical protein